MLKHLYMYVCLHACFMLYVAEEIMGSNVCIYVCMNEVRMYTVDVLCCLMFLIVDRRREAQTGCLNTLTHAYQHEFKVDDYSTFFIIVDVLQEHSD